MSAPPAWRRLPGPQPEVRRIGVYKSAGDQLLRSDMSEAQREQLTALLDDIYGGGWAGQHGGLGRHNSSSVLSGPDARRGGGPASKHRLCATPPSLECHQARLPAAPACAARGAAGGITLGRRRPWAPPGGRLCSRRPHAACRPAGFLDHVAAARGKTREEVAAFLDEGVFDMEVFRHRDFVDDLKWVPAALPAGGQACTACAPAVQPSWLVCVPGMRRERGGAGGRARAQQRRALH